MADQPWFKFYSEDFDMLLMLPLEEAGEVIQAAAEYFRDGTEPLPMQGPMAIAFSRLKKDIDRSAESYEAVCRRNRANRAKGKLTTGRPLEPKPEPEPEPELEPEPEPEPESESEVNQKEPEWASAASAAAYLFPAERDRIAQRIMYGTATAADFEAYRGYFHRGGDT